MNEHPVCIYKATKIALKTYFKKIILFQYPPEPSQRGLDEHTSQAKQRTKPMQTSEPPIYYGQRATLYIRPIRRTDFISVLPVT